MVVEFGARPLQDPDYPWPHRAEVAETTEGRRLLLIWYFRTGCLTKKDPLTPAHAEPWRRLLDQDEHRGRRILRKIVAAGLVPPALTDALWMLRVCYPRPAHPRALCGPPGIAAMFSATSARACEARTLSDVGLVLSKLLTRLDQGSERDPMTISDLALILCAHPGVLPFLHGKSRHEVQKFDLPNVRDWLRKKLSRFELRAA